MEIGSLRESEKPLRCAYCHADVDADPVVCPGCGTRVHSECLASLKSCPTLGCTSRIAGRSEVSHPEFAPFLWGRTILGALMIGEAVEILCRAMMRVGAEERLVTESLVGIPGLLFLVPAVRRIFGAPRVFSVLAVLVTVFLTLPAIVILYSPYSNTLTIEQVGWFSYTMSWVAGGEGMVRHTYTSTHALMVALVIAHVAERLQTRR